MIVEDLGYENIRLIPEFLESVKALDQLIHDPTQRKLSNTGTCTEGAYTLTLKRYSCVHPEERLSDLLELDIVKGDKKICSMCRNYGDLDYCFVSQNNEDFLITSEDYQAITIINLTTGVISSYGNWTAIKEGWGWCPIYFDFDTDENDIIIEGCYWGGPCETYYIPATDLNHPDFSAVEISIACDNDDNEEDDDNDSDC